MSDKCPQISHPDPSHYTVLAKRLPSLLDGPQHIMAAVGDYSHGISLNGGMAAANLSTASKKPWPSRREYVANRGHKSMADAILLAKWDCVTSILSTCRQGKKVLLTEGRQRRREKSKPCIIVDMQWVSEMKRWQWRGKKPWPLHHRRQELSPCDGGTTKKKK